VLIFKGVMIEWVVVKGWEEELVKSDGQPDIWGESRYQVRRPFSSPLSSFIFISSFYDALVSSVQSRDTLEL
jgi:hypothetical protein